MPSADLASKSCVPCRGGVPPLAGAELEHLLADLGPNGWRAVDGHHLEKEYPFKDFVTAVAFVNRVGAEAETQGHHPDLYLRVKSGQFREDLYYRLNVIGIKIPPLRERKEDILLLARYFLQQSQKTFDLPLKDFSKDVEKALTEYDWPGNVRELENTVKRAAILSKGSIIERKDLFPTEHPTWSVQEFLEGKLLGFLERITEIEKANLYDTVISEVEKALLGIVLKETKGNKVRAAKILGINRNTLNKKVKEYRLQ